MNDDIKYDPNHMAIYIPSKGLKMPTILLNLVLNNLVFFWCFFFVVFVVPKNFLNNGYQTN